MPVDWQQILFDPQNDLIGRLDRLAKKRFWDENLADEAFIWILDKLKADNWSRLDGFNGKAKPSTFLYTVFLRSLEDFSRTKFGYPRPKSWLKKLGDLWVQIWKRLCLEREPQEQIKMHLGDGDGQREAEIKQIMVTIKAKEPDCGQQEALTTIGGTDDEAFLFESQNDGEALGQDQSRRSTEEILDSGHLEELLQVIGLLTGFNGMQTASQNEALLNKMQQLSVLLKMEPTEQLVLQMKFQDGMKDAAIARALDMSNYQVKNSLEGIIKRLSNILSESGIDFR
ncbi:MAG TPA: sigma-70 family RNA polymerase sigma factor [Aeromonadales bacterium]|nr:sigma-70 family RNA polymerase sigma factor [Aeromonadales bacterium]